MVEVTAIRLGAFGAGHEHIDSVQWKNPETALTGISTVQAMVEFLRKPGARAYVSGGRRVVEVGIVEAVPPYIRTYADGIWTNNLLALPTF